jgi:hypothetical protein
MEASQKNIDHQGDDSGAQFITESNISDINNDVPKKLKSNDVDLKYETNRPLVEKQDKNLKKNQVVPELEMPHQSLGDLTKEDPTQPDYEDAPVFQNHYRKASCWSKLWFNYPL